jgi:allophanate hydrolase
MGAARPHRGLGFDIGTLREAYGSGAVTPADVVAEAQARIEARGSDGVWISLAPRAYLDREIAELARRRESGAVLPLYGIPFAVKDNIDVEGLPTTAACAAFAYSPQRDASVVARLRAAGAICLGKTNLDQFATGLVGVRSPYGVPRNPFGADHIPGGSSSGSAVAVAAGLVAFALGTDTAGSGRVPAAFNNVVGLKPSRGVLSADGVVPACRSLDCVSIFALTCEDAAAVAELARGYDAGDPYSRPDAGEVRFAPEAAPDTARFRFGVPTILDFAGDRRAAAAFEAAVALCREIGGEPVPFDLGPFHEAGTLLYDGPFVAERLEATGEILVRNPEALLPVTRSILQGAVRYPATEAFAALHRLARLRRQVAGPLAAVDALLVPTAPTIYTIAAVKAEPIKLNATLGLYANFVNLLDLAAWAVPTGMRGDRLPFGVTLIGPWGSDARLGAIGARLHRASGLPLGATETPAPHPPAPSPPAPAAGAIGEPAAKLAPPGRLPLAVVGAHLTGQPLNHQLTELGATLVGAARTRPLYRLYALAGTTPAKPGLVRVQDQPGAAIAVEIWSLPAGAFGPFVAAIPAPLCIGTVELEDGNRVSGFLCEAHAVAGARDITAFGGWRPYLEATGPQTNDQADFT